MADMDQPIIETDWPLIEVGESVMLLKDVGEIQCGSIGEIVSISDGGLDSLIAIKFREATVSIPYHLLRKSLIEYSINGIRINISGIEW